MLINLINEIADPSVIQSAILTLRVVIATFFCHLILGALLGWALAQKKWFGRTLLDIIITLPLIFPPMALGFFLLLLLGRNGYIGKFLNNVFSINLIFSIEAVILASVIAGLPLVVKPVEAAIRNLPKSLCEASYTLGHSRLATFFFVILPNIKGAFIAGLILATARAMGEVGITLMLGGNILGRTNTISLEIYNAVFNTDYNRALALSLLLAVISMLIFILMRIFTRNDLQKH